MTIKNIIEDLDDLVSMVNTLEYSVDALAQMDIDDLKRIGINVNNALSIIDDLSSYLTTGEDNE